MTRTFTGPDKKARSCEVKKALGFLTRPAVKLAHVFPKTAPAGYVGPENVIDVIILKYILPPKGCKLDFFDKFGS